MGLRGGGQFATFCRKKTESVTRKVTKFGKPQKGTKGSKKKSLKLNNCLCAFCAFLWLVLNAGEPSHH